MGQPIVRLGDLCSGHGPWPPRPNISASADVFVDGIAVHRVGDAWATHCRTSPTQCHTGVMATGSGTVFVNGLAVARVGDSVSCGSIAVQGSSTVSAG